MNRLADELPFAVDFLQHSDFVRKRFGAVFGDGNLIMTHYSTVSVDADAVIGVTGSSTISGASGCGIDHKFRRYINYLPIQRGN